MEKIASNPVTFVAVMVFFGPEKQIKMLNKCSYPKEELLKRWQEVSASVLFVLPGSRGFCEEPRNQRKPTVEHDHVSETGIGGGGQNVPNARGGGNSPRKLPLEDLDF